MTLRWVGSVMKIGDKSKINMLEFAKLRVKLTHALPEGQRIF